MDYCDLHLHSTASDGTDSPEALAFLAKKQGLSAIALTDHDTTSGIEAAQAAAKKHKIDFVPGIELSVTPQSLTVDRQQVPRGTFHLLGLWIEHDHPTLQAVQTSLFEARPQRNPQMIAKLQQLGVDIEYEVAVELVL